MVSKTLATDIGFLTTGCYKRNNTKGLQLRLGAFLLPLDKRQLYWYTNYVRLVQ